MKIKKRKRIQRIGRVAFFLTDQEISERSEKEARQLQSQRVKYLFRSQNS
jgi:hypothetical protein